MDTFRRYTSLAAAIHVLHDKSITLLNPATWDDKNDAYFMSEYKRQSGARSLLALCFAEREETYHHWRVFSHGPDGVCIEFKRNSLLSVFKGDNLIRQGYVNYKLIRELQSARINVEDLPFLKRHAYKDEKEYRVVFTSKRPGLESMSYDIKLSWINRIILSPWLAISVGKSVRDFLKAMDGCAKLRIGRSTLINSDEWRAITSRVGVTPSIAASSSPRKHKP